MDLMVLLACGLLLVGCGFYIGRPLLGRRGSLLNNTNARQLTERKEQLYSSILEIEFDRELGKLPEEDFQRMRSELEAEALSIIHQLDQLNGQASPDSIEQRIEREVAALHVEHPPAPTQPLQSPLTAAPAKFCGQCGGPRRAEDRFCTQCGKAFEETA
ncbi:MAG: hypothetical protein ACI906_001665 [Candidatus Latescibacterota bacterium]|jgi:hypothetical protein